MSYFAVITGGSPGIMEAAGAVSIRLKIELAVRAAAQPVRRPGVLFRHYFVRKLMFARYASEFVVFPGRFGTLDELFEMLTWP